MLFEALTDAISAYLVSNAGRTSISTTVPQVSGCYGSVGLTDLDLCQNSSLLPRSWLPQEKKEKGMGGVGRLGRMTEGSEPVGSSVRRSAVGSPCRTQGLVMTIS